MAQMTDAVIVGGGPAGLAAAIVLGRVGLRILLCEKQAFPVDKACGEGLMPAGVHHLHQLGVALEDGFPLAGVRYHSPDGSVATGYFRSGAGRGMRRTALSRSLLDAARQHRSLCILENAQVQLEQHSPEGIEVRVGGERVRTRLLVGADGLRSGVRRWAGLDQPRRHHWRWGVRQHYQIAPWSDCVEVYWSRLGVEAYVTPVAEEQISVAFLWHRDKHKAIRGRPFLPSLWAAFPELAKRLQGVPAVTAARAIGPLQQRSRAVVADGVLLIGDAAGYLDAITGEGLSLAFAQALSLSETVAPAMQTQTPLVSRQALARYQQMTSALMRPANQMTELALLLSRFPGLCNRVVRAFRADPALFQELLAANMGIKSPWQPPVAGRLFARLLLTLPDGFLQGRPGAATGR